MSFFRKIGRVFEDTLIVAADVVLPVHISQGRIKLGPGDLLKDLKREKQDLKQVGKEIAKDGETILRAVAEEGVTVGELLEGVAGAVELAALAQPELAPFLVPLGVGIAAVGGISIGAGKGAEIAVKAIDVGRRIHKKVTEKAGGSIGDITAGDIVDVGIDVKDDVLELIGILKQLKALKDGNDKQNTLVTEPETEETVGDTGRTSGGITVEQALPAPTRKNQSLHQPHQPQHVFKDPQELFL